MTFTAMRSHCNLCVFVRDMAVMGRLAWNFSPVCLSVTRQRSLLKTWTFICRAHIWKQQGYASQNLFSRSFYGLQLNRHPRTVVKASRNREWLRRYVSAIVTDKAKSSEETIRQNIPRRVVGDVYHSFQLVQEEYIPDIDSIVRKYIHSNTGAQVVSVLNKEENKTFGVVFRTPVSKHRIVANVRHC